MLSLILCICLLFPLGASQRSSKSKKSKSSKKRYVEAFYNIFLMHYAYPFSLNSDKPQGQKKQPIIVEDDEDNSTIETVGSKPKKVCFQETTVHPSSVSATPKHKVCFLAIDLCTFGLVFELTQ